MLGPLRRKHKVVVAAVSDPRIDELAAGRDDVGEVYAAAAAEVDRLRRAGTAAYPPRTSACRWSRRRRSASPPIWPTTTSRLKKAGQL